MKKGCLKHFDIVAARNRGALDLNEEPKDVNWNCYISVG